MGSLIQDIRSALPLLPESRKQHARTRSLHLDDLLDTQTELSGGARDMIFMSYRLLQAERHFAKEFFKKPPKSATLKDLCLLAFALIISRDQIPLEVLAHEVVEASKGDLPKELVGVLNAYCRKLGREKENWLRRFDQNPELLLGPSLLKRWKEHPLLLTKTAEALRQRPEAGIWAFDSQCQYQHWKSEDFFRASDTLMAMNPGSHDLISEFLNFAPKTKSSEPIHVLDLCAAPGAKLIYTLLWAKRQGLPFSALALEKKFHRMKRLDVNLKRFSLKEKVACELIEVGKDPLPDQALNQEWSYLLVDLPCSGSGTLGSRPDLSSDELADRVENLKEVQVAILGSLKAIRSQRTLVSVCSVDPQEIQHISAVLGRKPSYSSLERELPFGSDGLCAWFL